MITLKWLLMFGLSVSIEYKRYKYTYIVGPTKTIDEPQKNAKYEIA